MGCVSAADVDAISDGDALSDSVVADDVGAIDVDTTTEDVEIESNDVSEPIIDDSDDADLQDPSDSDDVTVEDDANPKNPLTANALGADGDVGTFSDLYTLINNAPAGSTIDLQMDYRFDSSVDDVIGTVNHGSRGTIGIGAWDSFYIEIAKDLTINGNGHTIDGNNQARIFSVTGSSSLTLNNLKLINGKAQPNQLINPNCYGGAILASGNTVVTIDNCIFANNTANGDNRYQGGAIRSGAELTITNSKFLDNSALAGGAIYAGSNTVEITNCLFEGNNATTNGAVIHSGTAIVTIRDSNITKNNGTYAAISVGGGTTNIYSSILANNDGVNGSVFYFNGGTINAKGCVILNNTATYGPNGFYRSGNMDLDENWWGTNRGPNYSITNVNGTYYNYFDYYVLTETLTSPITVDINFELYSGNAPTSSLVPRFITITTDTALIDPTEGWCPAPLTIEFTTSDDAIITAKADNQEVHLKVFAGENKKPINVLEVAVDDVTLPDQPVVNVTSDVDGIYNLTLGENVYQVNVVDGKGTFDFAAEGIFVDVGKYTIIVSRVNDPVYMTIFKPAEFEVKKYETQLVISTADTPSFGDDVTITHTLSPEEATGFITYYVDGSTTGTQLSIADDFVLSGLSAGEHTIVAVYSGDAKYGGDSDTLVINVAKATLAITVPDVTVNYPNKGTIKVYSNKDGTYTINVNEVPYTVAVVGGEGSFEVEELLDVGTYIMDWHVPTSENYTGTFGNAFYIVLNTAPEFEITGSDEIVYGVTNTITHTITEGATGEIVYAINGGYVETLEVGESFNTGVLDAGHYTVVATYLGDNNYGSVSGSFEFDVLPIEVVVTVENVEVYYPGTGTVSLTSSVAGTYTITINSKEYEIVVEADGATGTVDVTDVFEVGVYPISVSADLGNNYKIVDIAEAANYTVIKPTTLVIITVDDFTYGDDASATITLMQGLTPLADQEIIVVFDTDLENPIPVNTNQTGQATVSLSSLNAGSHMITAVFTGDEHYAYAFDEQYFNVAKAQSAITIAYDDGEFTITLDGVNGEKLNETLNIEIDDVPLDIAARTENGVFTFTPSGLAPGQHSIYTVFTGNDNYLAIGDSLTFAVPKITPVLEIEGDEYLMPGDEATVTISLTDPTTGEGIDGTVIVKVNGETYVEVLIDGEDELVLYDLPATTLPIFAKFMGDDTYNAVENNTEEISFMFEVAYFDIVIPDGVYGEPITVTVENVTDFDGNNLTGYLMGEVVNEDGEQVAPIAIRVSNGKGTGTIKPFEAGALTAIATFTDDDYEYVSETKNIKFNVAKAQSTITVIYADDVFTITLDGVNGEKLNETVSVEMDGTPIDIAAKTVNGTYEFTDDSLAPGDHTVYVSFAGNTNYIGSTGYDTFETAKEIPVMTVTGDEVDYGEPATVTIKLTDEDGTPIVGTVLVTLDLTVDGIDAVVVTDENGEGQATFPVQLYGVYGTYDVTAKFIGDDNYISVIKYAQIVIDMPTDISFDLEVDLDAGVVKVSNATDANDDAVSGYIMGELFKDGQKIDNLELSFLDDGAGTIALPDDLAPGDYTVMITVMDEDMALTGTDEIAFTVEPKSGVQISADVADYPFTQSGSLVVDVKDIDDVLLSGNLTIVIDSEPYDVVEITNGHLELGLAYLDIGEHNMEIIFYNPNYLDASYIVHFEVLKVDPVIKVTGTTVEYGEPATVKVEVSYGEILAQGRVIVVVDWQVDGLTEVIELEEGAGEATFLLSPYVAEGEYTITATYLGDNKFNEAVNNTEKIIVTPSTNMEVSVSVDVPLTVGEDVIVTITAVDGSGQPVAVTAANLTVKGETIEYPVHEDGTVNLGPFPAGHYEIEAIVNDGFHTPAGDDVAFDVAPTSGAVITTSVADYPFTEEGNLVVDVTDAAGDLLSGNLTILLDGEPFDVIEIIDGHLDFELGYIDIGKHNVEVIFTNPDYLDVSSVAHFEVLKVDPVVKVTGTTVEYGDPATVKVEVSYGDILAQGRVIVVVDWGVDGLTEVIELEEGAGEATFQLSPYVGDGEYTVTATYLGDNKFNEAVNNTEKVIITPSTIMEVSVTANQPSEGEDLIITITAVDESGADIPVSSATISIDGATDEYDVNEDGTVNLGQLPAGSHEIEVIVDDGFHTPAGEDITVVVSEIPAKDTVITVTASDINLGEDAFIEFTLKDIDGNDIDGILNVTVGDINKTVTVTGGKGNVTVSDLHGGICPVVAVFEGNKQYAASTGTGAFNVTRKATTFIYEDMVTNTMDMEIDGRNGEYFCWTLVDADGNPIANKPVSIGFNGKIYNRTTNATGGAKLQINLARYDIYTFGIAFLGDDDYNGTFAVAKITTQKTEPKLTVPNKSYKASASTKTLTATFKSTLGNPAAGRWITFTVNGKTYKAQTNANGVASVNVSLKTKGTYKVTAKFEGDNTFKATTKTATLKLT